MTMKALVATLQLINSGTGENPLATISIEYGTFDLASDRGWIERSMQHWADQLAIDLNMRDRRRLPVMFEEREVSNG
jgi:hypothetical protein